MKTVGIIAEYNPFHSGHRYQFDQVRAMTGADYIVVVMSGDFVQRGEPAVYDKYTRASIALSSGADLILELPSCFAVSSAEDFAACGTAVLDCLGTVDLLCFGSEAGELSLLQKAARILVQEPEGYRKILLERQKEGVSFPKARGEALTACIRCESPCGSQESAAELEKALTSPNNILGIEYLKALYRRQSRIRPVTIKRTGQGYHGTELPSGDCFPSASALRQAIRQKNFDYFHDFHELGQDSCPPAVFADDLSQIFNWKLLELLESRVSLTDFADFSPEMAARLERRALDFTTFTGRIEQLKTKQYTYTRISRALLHLLLGITSEQLADARSRDYVSFIRILGFRRSALPLLNRIKQSCGLPLVTKTADARRLLDSRSLELLNRDMYASHLYQSIQFQKSGICPKNEYTRSVIIC